MKSKAHIGLCMTLSLILCSIASVIVLGGVNVPPSCYLDLDIDSDNNNRYFKPSESNEEEVVEMKNPGKIIMKNSDDDDMDSRPDCDDAVFNGDTDFQDMAVLVVKHVSPNGTGSVVLKVNRSGFIRVFKRDKTLLIGPEVGKSCSLDVNGRLELFVEGMNVGQVVLTLTCNHGNQDNHDDVLVTVVNAELRIDSLNKHGADIPPYDAEAERIKNKDGTAEFPGKIIYMNDMDVDGDTIPDFLDGFGRISDPQFDQNSHESSDEKITTGKFAPLILKTDMQGQNVQLQFDYDMNDTATITGLSLDQANGYATEAALSNPLSGRIRVWKKNADQHRDPRSVMAGGDFVPPNVTLSLSSLGLSSSASQVTLYVEGIGTWDGLLSSGWGIDKIKVRGIVPDIVHDTAELLDPQDSVSYTVVRCVYKVCVYRPYICLRDGDNNVLQRQLFYPDYSSPGGMLMSYADGQCAFEDYDPNGVLHGMDAFMGHSFAKVEIRMPELSANYWTGQTGCNDKNPKIDAIRAIKAGTLVWSRASDGQEDPQDKSSARYRILWNPESSIYYACGSGNVPGSGVDKKLMAVREFRLRPEVAQTINEYRCSEHPFGGYGLDAILKGATDSRVGCGSYIGILTERSGLLTPGQVNGSWGVEGNMPIVPLDTMDYNLIEMYWEMDFWYRYGVIDGLQDVLYGFHNAVDLAMILDNRTGTWNSPRISGQVESLKFCDPSKMAVWIDSLNQTTSWQQPALEYKDRGVTVRYDVPTKSSLTQWKDR